MGRMREDNPDSCCPGLMVGQQLLEVGAGHSTLSTWTPEAVAAQSPSQGGLAKSGSGVGWNQSQHCRLLAGLVPDQLQMCRRNLELMTSIVRAARQTQGVCQETFRAMRWNCSSILRAPSFGPDLLKGTRESAFAHALAAAAASLSISRACTSGEIPLCSCGSVPSESKYLAAIRVTHRLIGPRKQLIPKEVEVRPVTETDLVYLINSPDYCTPNPHLGSLGTQDRQCNKTSLGSDSCNLMCCGRGYNTYTEELEERCHCKYHWCCYVVCKKCRRQVERHVCK
ncbi:PREDICTED: protein Wnt-11b-like [Chaetura pelagica]|uniref:protein Wnt-11b-like n=1 Tax=Chaetura pelagica TaxID=8897 RepID=UPI000523B517|nr:PREDICTED: protein Wnt-11b-like [Chaetura pelagica]